MPAPSRSTRRCRQLERVIQADASAAEEMASTTDERRGWQRTPSPLARWASSKKLSSGSGFEKPSDRAVSRRSCAWWKHPAQGRLDERGRTDQFEGIHREMLRGINDMLDAILLPIGEGNRILAQISTGKIDELIAHTYKGDHEKMKLAVNNVGTVLQTLQKEMARLIDASKDGQLTERGKPENFQGAYAEIVRGVNTMLDAILLPIGEGNRILAQISNRQDRRTDRAHLQRRSRKDEAGRQQRRHGRCRLCRRNWRG